MGNPVGSIDYDALAAAFLRAASGANAGAGADSTLGLGSSEGRGPGDAVAVVMAGLGVQGKKDDRSASWAEEVQEDAAVGEVVEASDVGSESSGGSVTFSCKPPVVGGAVRGAVKFGGFSDNFDQVAPVVGAPEQAGAGYFAKFVRSERALGLRKELGRFTGVKFPKCAHADIAVCTFTAGVMPAVALAGKQRLKALAAVGDAAITMNLVLHMVSKGLDVESAQAARSKYTSNVHLRQVMKGSGLVHFVSYPSGVDPEVTLATATAFEAIVGVLVLYRPPYFTKVFLQKCGVLV